jgi:two-component system response regulator RegX3
MDSSCLFRWRRRGGSRILTSVEPSKELAGARVLVVEDDREIAELIEAYLARDGALVELAASSEEAEARCAVTAHDLVLLDLGLPGADGLEFLKRFRAKSLAPVIIVSARESDEDKVAGLGLGADDFVSKPFSPKVLAARVRAQLRRASYSAPAPERLAFGPFLIDLEGGFLERAGERVPLSRREFELLAFLAGNEGRSFGPEELYRAVWGPGHGDLSTVAVHVQRVRRKIEEDPHNPRYLRTVPGSGYRFVGGGD